MKKIQLLAMTVACTAVALTGCSSVKLDESAKDGSLLAESSQNDQKAANPYENSIYFALNSYTVEPKYNTIIERHVRDILSNPRAQVVIEGNTDSRGSREYNLALGQKRSEAVKRRLQLLGVPAARVEAVSFGSEKPVADGENEQAWQQNRRADVIRK